ncbi:ATP-binding cassette domain-containing protein [Candidatus Dependentiae bacterium]|nr:ATP-binding cassette domain-containing protein [Candidatus Dependentiae bacterium]MBU4387245.1 ATP-binding cassette domain-containing protein [Candidatus Dependentiae bacterium]MCG2756552.1 ATP-binding cassette domain-containing protein [Candidatus Dependentiae bacterium]
MNKPVIEVKDLTKIFELKQKRPGLLGSITSIFSQQTKKTTVVDHISFSVEPGELLAFIGPNGAGKSTTIKMLTGILYPSSGNIKVLDLDPAENRQKLAYSIGSVFGQRSQLWYHLSPLDTYNLLSRLYELDQTKYKNRLNFLIDSFELKNLINTPVRKLSLGQRMRCEIVASLIHQPKIIFLDEPTIGLDVIAKQQIREVILFLNKQEGVTIFLTSHDAGDIETLANRTIIINYGKIIFDGVTEQLKNNFISKKIIEFITEEPILNFNFDGGKIVEQTKYSIKIEIEQEKSSMDKLLSFATNNFDIKDINIYEPPMEEIISNIYQMSRKNGI